MESERLLAGGGRRLPTVGLEQAEGTAGQARVGGKWADSPCSEGTLVLHDSEDRSDSNCAARVTLM